MPKKITCDEAVQEIVGQLQDFDADDVAEVYTFVTEKTCKFLQWDDCGNHVLEVEDEP